MPGNLILLPLPELPKRYIQLERITKCVSCDGERTRIVMLSLLVVDDERNMLLMLDRVLSRDGYQVKTANNAEQALELVDSEIFHLAVLDIKMLPMDGVALLKEIRKRSPDIRVIMTTAYPTVDSRDECIKLGACGYLVKPLEISKLKDVLCHLIAV